MAKPKFKFDYIVPLFNAQGADFPYRCENLKKIVENTPKDVHIIAVEQFNDPAVPKISDAIETSDNVTIILKKYDGPFCKGWLYNVGAKAAKSSKLALGECDCWSEEPEYWSDFEAWIAKHKFKWAFGWNKIIKERKNRDPVFLRPKRGGSEGGIVYFDKGFYWSIGAHNEAMLDLGAIDCEIIRRAEYLAKGYPIFPRTVMHGLHSWSRLKGRSRSQKQPSVNYKNNRIIYAYVRRHLKKEVKRLSSFAPKLGGPKPLAAIGAPYPLIKGK